MCACVVMSGCSSSGWRTRLACTMLKCGSCDPAAVLSVLLRRVLTGCHLALADVSNACVALSKCLPLGVSLLFLLLSCTHRNAWMPRGTCSTTRTAASSSLSPSPPSWQQLSQHGLQQAYGRRASRWKPWSSTRYGGVLRVGRVGGNCVQGECWGRCYSFFSGCLHVHVCVPVLLDACVC